MLRYPAIPSRLLVLPLNAPLEIVPPEPSTPDAEAAWVLSQLQQELNRIQRSVRMALQGKLAVLTGRSMATLGDNQSLAESIQTLLETHSLRVRCQVCGHPAILRVSPRKGMESGAFVFDHTVDGRRTFHGGTAVVPVLQLTAKPPRKKRDPS